MVRESWFFVSGNVIESLEKAQTPREVISLKDGDLQDFFMLS